MVVLSFFSICRSQFRISVSACVSALEKGSQWSMALDLLSKMPCSGLLPNIISFSAAISACEKAGKWQEALHLLSDMPAAAVVPDRINFNASISACEKGSQWETALQLLASMVGDGIWLLLSRLFFNILIGVKLP